MYWGLDNLRFFNSVSVILCQWKGDNIRPCTMELCSLLKRILHPGSFKPGLLGQQNSD